MKQYEPETMSRYRVSPETERVAIDELLAARTRIDLLEDELGELKKAFKAVIQEEWSLERSFLGVLRGTVSDQVALPGIEAQRRNYRTKVGQALRVAVEAIGRITGVDAEEDEFSDPPDEDLSRTPLASPAVAAAVQRFKDSIPEGTSVSFGVNGKMTTVNQGTIADFNAEAAAVAREKADAIPPIEWSPPDDAGCRVGKAVEGCYSMERLEDGGFTAQWCPTKGRGKVLAIAKPEGEAEAACLAHHVEKAADGMLSNAGDGALTKSDVKGPATARKKGGRR